MTSLRSGHVQSHGALLAVDEHDLVIVAASDNTEEILGAARVVGGGLASVILRGLLLHIAKPIEPSDLVAHLACLVGRTARRT